MIKDVLNVYSSNCLKCSRLESSQKRTFPCSYESGNTDCPAHEVEIVITGKLTKAVNSLGRARANKDYLLESKILAWVSKQSKSFRDKFRGLVENGHKNS